MSSSILDSLLKHPRFHSLITETGDALLGVSLDTAYFDPK